MSVLSHEWILRHSAYMCCAVWVLLGAVLYSHLGLQYTLNGSIVHGEVGTAAYFVIVTLTTIGFGDFVPATVLGRILLTPYCIVGLPLVAIVLIDIGRTPVDSIVAYCPSARLRHHLERNRVAALFVLLIVTTLITAAVISRFETAYTGRQGHMVYMSALYLCFATTSTIGYGEYVPYSPLSRATICVYAFLTLAIFSLLIGEASEWWSRLQSSAESRERERRSAAAVGKRTPLLDDDRLGGATSRLSAVDVKGLDGLGLESGEDAPGCGVANPLAAISPPTRGLSCPVLGREPYL